MTDFAYPLILADPPWRYGFSRSRRKGIERHYATMTLAQICALNVPAVAARDCVLFLWATAPKLRDAFQVLDAWGFTYKTNDIWLKEGRKGMGYYTRVRHELLLIATRGNPRTPAPKCRPDSVMVEKPREHSRKPEASYARIDAMYPDDARRVIGTGAYAHMARLYLFADNLRPGWDSWGDGIITNPALTDALLAPRDPDAPAIRRPRPRARRHLLT